MPPATLVDQVYRDLCLKVESGALAPGTQLVNRSLCKELGVSTIPLREAIQRLTSEGLIEHIPNAGAFVRKFNRREMLQLCEFRGAMEMFGVGCAVSRIEPDQVEQLETICSNWLQMARTLRDSGEPALLGDDNQNWIALDVKFHNILIEAAGNVWLKRVMERLRILSLAAINKPAEMKLGRAVRNCRIHSGIVRGLRKRDLELASHWMEMHTAYSMAFVKATMQDT
jgi:DNA-binding GntR family transcriptional regulator